MAYKVFQNGFPLLGSEINTYLMNQAVATFPDTATRASAITSPAEGQLTYRDDANAFEYWDGSSWVNLNTGSTVASQVINDKTANYSIVAGDAWKLIRSTSGAITITIDNVLSVGQRIDFVQYGAGQVTFAAGAGVTLNSAGGRLKTAAQYSGASVEMVAAGTYWLFGDLTA